MKYTFVGDIHGKVDAVRAALDMDGQIVFVGDFMDSFDQPAANHRSCLQLVLDAIRAGKAQAIYGNHELSYTMTRVHRSSGWSASGQAIMLSHDAEIRELFRPHLLLADNVLVTHAGLTRQIFEEHALTVAQLDEYLALWWHDRWSPVHGIGTCRGGNDPVGGTFWCDYNREFEPIPGLTQVFGHTASGSGGIIRCRENSYNVDCLDVAQKFLTLEIGS